MIFGLIIIVAITMGFVIYTEKKQPKHDMYKEEEPDKTKKEPRMVFNVGEKVKVYQGAGWGLQKEGKLLDGKILARKISYSREYDGVIKPHKDYVVKCGKYTILASEEDVFPVEEANNETTK